VALERLALEVARDLVEAYPDGAWLVQIAPLSEEVLVPKAVAEALKCRATWGAAL
jgi:predicted ATPase